MIGTTISHYKIISELGRGGMGVVYKAVDTKLDRPVALKFLSARALEDEDATVRFFREAKAAAALDHENICTIHEIDEVDGHTFMAMAFIEGRTIKQMVLERPLPIDQALDIAIQTARGLQAAHESGVVHRDIKSSNLMLTPRDQVKILDFGLAQLAEGSKLTKTQTILGTPAYMSPEQVRGENTDRRTDMWSLGVVLYEMVTGKRPFAGEAEAALTYGILNKEPEPVTGLRSGLPLDLDRIVSKALAKDPDERYQHVDEFMVDLRGLRGKRSGAERVERRKESANRQRPSALRRRVLQLKAAIGAAIVLSFLFVGWLFTKSDRQAATLDGQGAGESSPSLAVLPLENLSGDPEQDYFTDGMTEELISNLGTIRSLRVVSRTSAMQYKGTKKLLPEIARELNVNHLIEGSVLRADDQIRVTVRLTEAAADRQVWSHSYERPLRDIISLQREIAREVARAIELETSPDEEARLSGGRPVDPAAYTEYLKGRMFLAQRHPESFRRAEQSFQRAIESNPRYARAYAGLADSYLLMMWYSLIHPRKGSPIAERSALKALEIDDSLAEAYVSLAFARFFEWEASEASFRRALELNPGYANGRHWYAVHLMATGRHEQAIEQMKRALGLDPHSLIFNTDLGAALYYARRLTHAAEQLRATVEMDPLFFRAHYTLGDVYAAQGQYDKATSEMRQAVELSRRNARPVAGLAHAYAKSGERRKALDLLNELKERSEYEYIAPIWFAHIHVGLGNTDEAIRALNKGWQDRQPWIAFVKV